MREQREFVRIMASLVVIYKVLESPQAEGKALSENISGGGINVFLPCKLKTGTVLDLKITLSNAKVAFTRGEVIRQEKLDDLGEDLQSYLRTSIKFAQISEQEREKILEFILDRLKLR